MLDSLGYLELGNRKCNLEMVALIHMWSEVLPHKNRSSGMNGKDRCERHWDRGTSSTWGLNETAMGKKKIDISRCLVTNAQSICEKWQLRTSWTFKAQCIRKGFWKCPQHSKPAIRKGIQKTQAKCTLWQIDSR